MANAPASFAQLLESAVNEPGILSTAYRAFHTFSIGNQLLAWAQCDQRGIEPGPIATYQRWKELGRQVRRGEKAITLCRPVTIKRTDRNDDGSEEPATFTTFVYRPFWFTLTQTDGKALPEPEMPTWSKDRAMTALNIREIAFDLPDGNCLRFATGRSIAINPVNPMPHKTRFHEVGHILLGYTTEGTLNDDERTPRDLRECEAEAVALLCCAALNLPGAEHCRGYIQSWWGKGNPIPERSAQRVLKTADAILRAGSTESGAES